MKDYREVKSVGVSSGKFVELPEWFSTSTERK